MSIDDDINGVCYGVGRIIPIHIVNATQVSNSVIIKVGITRVEFEGKHYCCRAVSKVDIYYMRRIHSRTGCFNSNFFICPVFFLNTGDSYACLTPWGRPADKREIRAFVNKVCRVWGDMGISTDRLFPNNIVVVDGRAVSAAVRSFRFLTDVYPARIQLYRQPCRSMSSRRLANLTTMYTVAVLSVLASEGAAPSLDGLYFPGPDINLWALYQESVCAGLAHFTMENIDYAFALYGRLVSMTELDNAFTSI